MARGNYPVYVHKVSSKSVKKFLKKGTIMKNYHKMYNFQQHEFDYTFDDKPKN